VSGHERERLSAYLDGELPATEHAEVRATSPPARVRAFLADLAAVDAEAAGLPAHAPDGYFDRFPSQVVARIEADPKPRVRPGRPPVWTWAAAAALLLAVVTPLTLRERRARLAPPPASEAPVLRPPAGGRRGTRSGAGDARADGGARPASFERTLRRRPAPDAREARRPPDHAGRAKNEAEAPPVQPATAGPAPVGHVAAAEAPRASAVREEAFADAVAPPESAGGPPPATRTAAVPAAASLESVAPAPEQARTPMGKAGIVDEAGRAFRRLDAVRPASAEEWRRLREEWLAFAAAHSGDRRADEARVRAIEAGREAWRASGDEADEQAFRRDAAAYLAAAESLQKPRVEQLVAEAGRAP